LDKALLPTKQDITTMVRMPNTLGENAPVFLGQHTPPQTTAELKQTKLLGPFPPPKLSPINIQAVSLKISRPKSLVDVKLRGVFFKNLIPFGKDLTKQPGLCNRDTVGHFF